MSENTKGSLATPRPPRKNVFITPHKGGRVARFECRLTLAEKEIIMRLIDVSGLSGADWLMSVVRDDNVSVAPRG